MSAATKAQLQIHLCVLLWGFTAILGRLITLPALPLVLWRMGLLAVLLAFVPAVWRTCRALPLRLLGAYALIGLILALHWLTFYLSIKWANASVGATCMALTPVMLAFIEPVATGRRFDPRDLLLGVVTVAGVGLLLGGIPSGMRAGVAIGAVSALLVAIFGALNKRYIHDADALSVTAIEMAAGAALMAVLLPFVPGDGPGVRGPGAPRRRAPRRPGAAVARCCRTGCTWWRSSSCRRTGWPWPPTSSRSTRSCSPSRCSASTASWRRASTPGWR